MTNDAISPMNARPAAAPAGRITELDWLRIAAFGLLILYHAGMFYVPWDWHVKSPHPVPALEPWMMLSAPWRLCLLFVVSGAAMGLALQAGSAAASASARSKRLLLPLLLGMAVIVPPQPYLEVVEKLGYGGSYMDFLARYFAADHSFCRDGHCLTLPTWNHLWFVAYLWAYTLLLLAACRLWGTAWLAHPRWQGLVAGCRLLWLPCLLLALLRQHLVLPFPSTHNLLWDWFNHALFGSVFLLGLGLFGHADDRHGAWRAALRLRWWALGGAVLVLVGMPRVLQALGGWDALPAWGQAAWLALGATRHWLPVLAALGFARHHLRGRSGRWRHILAEAAFPAYIVHQTVIVVAAHHLVRLGLPQAVEATVLVALTFAACGLTYLLVRRVRWLRPWFGMPQPRGAP